MPIKDLIGKNRITRLDKIKLGIKVQGSKSDYPKAVDYFVCPEEVRAVYGDKPKKLSIMFHSDDIEEVFPQYYKRYGKSTGLVCKGDGEFANAINPETKVFEEITCNGAECDLYKKNQCKRIGNLLFMVAGVNRFGVYQLDTSSLNSILNINGSIKYAKQLTRGKLALVPFILEVVPQEVNPEGKKKTVWVLHLEADISKMIKSLDSNPREIFALDSPKDIEECLYPKDIVDSNINTDEVKPEPVKPEVKTEVKPITRTRHQLVDDISVNRDLLNMDKETLAKEVISKYGTNDPVKLTIEQLNEINEELEEDLRNQIDEDMEQPELK